MGKKVTYLDHKRMDDMCIEVNHPTPPTYMHLAEGDHVIVHGLYAISGTIEKLCVSSYNDGTYMHWVKTKTLEVDLLVPHDIVMYADYDPAHMPLYSGQC